MQNITSASIEGVSSTTITSNTDSWKIRRRFMVVMTLFFMILVMSALFFGKTESVAQIAIIMGVGALVSIFGFYVAGATWDDHSIRQFQISSLLAVKGQKTEGEG